MIIDRAIVAPEISDGLEDPEGIVLQRLRFVSEDAATIAAMDEMSETVRGSERRIAEIFWAEFSRDNPEVSALGAENDERMTERAVRYIHAKFHRPSDPEWVTLARNNAIATINAGVDPTKLYSALTEAHRDTLRIIAERCHGDFDRLQRLIDCLIRMSGFELEITSFFSHEVVRSQERCAREEALTIFREQITKAVQRAGERRQSVGVIAAEAKNSAYGMLGKSSEVAAASEQSAVAMREAAHTAAGLIRAIEQAREEVEQSVDVTSRAAAQSEEAVSVSQALSEHTKSIESILGLIRDIAGQTNLLALNATIEAARAGDAGRGFAVVAQEVKSLANQTAKATDEIDQKISAIQAATLRTVEMNGSIRETVGEVQSTSDRIRQAMEAQAQTVTMITSAVDETALAADSMSGTIAAIRRDSEHVTDEIDRVSHAFAEMDGFLSKLDRAAEEFVTRFANG